MSSPRDGEPYSAKVRVGANLAPARNKRHLLGGDYSTETEKLEKCLGVGRSLTISVRQDVREMVVPPLCFEAIYILAAFAHHGSVCHPANCCLANMSGESCPRSGERSGEEASAGRLLGRRGSRGGRVILLATFKAARDLAYGLSEPVFVLNQRHAEVAFAGGAKAAARAGCNIAVL